MNFWTREEGVKKSKIFADFINGGPLTDFVTLFPCRNPPGHYQCKFTTKVEDFNQFVLIKNCKGIFVEKY